MPLLLARSSHMQERIVIYDYLEINCVCMFKHTFTLAEEDLVSLVGDFFYFAPSLLLLLFEILVACSLFQCLLLHLLFLKMFFGNDFICLKDESLTNILNLQDRFKIKTFINNGHFEFKF